MALLVGGGVDGPLVQDRVDGDGRLARLAVADDELPLATADGDEAVDGLWSQCRETAALSGVRSGSPAGRGQLPARSEPVGLKDGHMFGVNS